MKVSTKLNGTHLRIYLDGELDQSVAEDVKKQIDKQLETLSPESVVFDMSRLSFMDSTGIGLILGRYKKLRNRNIPVFIGSPNTQIDKVVRISGLYSIIPLTR